MTCPEHINKADSDDFVSQHAVLASTRFFTSSPCALVARVLDGRAIAKQLRAEVGAQVKHLKSKHGTTPGLAIIVVGDRKDTAAYVRMKDKACAEVGVRLFQSALPASASEACVTALVRRYNYHPHVHGILVQLPLPAHVQEANVLAQVALHKDVDGFHPDNIGRLTMKNRRPLFAPCTPAGCLELLRRAGIKTNGKRAVVLGRSNIVGMPAAMLLNKHDATVTLCHSHTPDVEGIVREADIVIAAARQPRMVRGSWLKPGATVIDVGTNAIDDPSKKSGYRLVGDVNFEECAQVAGAISPVPGGMGPITIAMLMANTARSAQLAIERPAPPWLSVAGRWVVGGVSACVAGFTMAVGVRMLVA